MLKTRWTTLACVAMLVFAAIAIGANRATNLLRHEATQTRRRLVATENDLLLVLQQTNELARQIFAKLDDKELSDSDKELLETWLAYDEQFIRSQHLASGAFRFERAVSAHRAVSLAMLLQEFDRAERHSTLCDALLQQISDDNPSVLPYQAMRLENLANLAYLKSLSDPSRSAAVYQTALRLVDSPTLTGSSEANVALSDPLRKLAEIAWRSGNAEEARGLCQRLVNVNQQLAKAHPANAEFQERAATANALFREMQSAE